MLVGEVFARMELDSRQYEKDLDKLEGKTQKKAMTLGGLFKGAFSFALGMGLVSGFRSLGGAITDFVKTAARTEVLNVAMLSVARSSGYMRSAVEADKKAVMELGIAEQEATQILTRFMQAQLDTADAAKLARVAQDAAVIAGYNSSQAAEQMTEAIAKQRPELLSAFGMTRNMNEIYNDYAKTVGKTAKQLSEAEKKQAMLNYILKEGEKIAGTYEASMGAVGKQIGSLPRYWDTLKNAIAKPLALPALSVIVDGITNALKNAISWAEANKAALQMWGQTAAGVASRVVEYFKWWYGVLIRNWQLIKVVTAALLAYATVTKIAAAATTIFKVASSVLNGTIAANVPILSALSIAINTYRLQVALAPVATNIFTAALYRLQAALHAVHVALGPIGWAILLISGLITVGMALWNKYTQSLQKASQSFNEADLRKRFRELEAQQTAAQGAAKGQDSLADAVKKAGKAAAKNLQPFDEINQLQGEMADNSADMLDALHEGDIELGAVPALDFDDMLAGLEPVKGTLGGLWEWIKQEAGKIWDKVKEKWGNFKDWAGNLWDTIKIKWNNFKDWVQEKWNTFWDPIKQKWNNFKTWAGNLWDSVKIKWDNFKTNIQEKWNAFWEPIKTRWNSFKSWAGELLAPVRQKWNSFVTWAHGIWDGLLKKWNEIKSWPLWKWISDKVNWLKNVFNFKWSLPKIKIPRFSVSWSTAGFWGKVGEFLGLPGKPIIGVEWVALAKGGVVNDTTLAMIGESGAEAVVPLERNTGWMDVLAGRLAAALQKTQLAGAGGGGDIYVYIGNEQIDAYIYRSQDRRNIRSNGR